MSVILLDGAVMTPVDKNPRAIIASNESSVGNRVIMIDQRESQRQREGENEKRLGKRNTWPERVLPYRLQRYPTGINTSQLAAHASRISPVYLAHMHAAGSEVGPSAAIRFCDKSP